MKRDPATCDHRWAAPGAEMCPECFIDMAIVRKERRVEAQTKL